MSTESGNAPLSIGEIAQRIHLIRGQRVLLDTDLAAFYGETTKRLNQQVNRNRQLAAKVHVLERKVTVHERSIAELVDSGEPRWQGPYLQKAIPPDPWGRAFIYRSPGINDDFDLSSFGKDGRPGGEVDNADVSFR